jgi:aspartate/methionine/tyrosine aminotransferase
LADRLLNEANVATTPGVDFDTEEGHLAIRLSFAGTSEEMKQATKNITAWVQNNT